MTPATVPVAAPSMFAIFRKRDFSLLWVAQLVSTIGSSLTDLAAGILVFRLTGSALNVGLMLMATSVPTLVVGLLAGVFVDRFDRKRILIGSDVLRCVLVASIPWALGAFGIVSLYVIVFIASGVRQFFDPANDSVLPEIASDEELASANSFLSISSFGSTAVGFAAAGFLASSANINVAFWVDALTFIFSATCIFFVRIGPLVVEERTTVGIVFQNLVAGLRYLVSTPILRSAVIVNVPVIFSFGLWNVLLLPFSLRMLNATEFEYGLQEGLTSLGFVFASLIMAKIADRLREGQWIVISVLGMGIVGLGYATATNVPFAIVMVMISGFMNAPLGIARRLIFQRNTPREMRGRVSSAFSVARDLGFVMGMAAAGLGEVIDLRLLVVVASVMLLVAAFITQALPGLGQPATEWRRAVALLRAAPMATITGTARRANASDLDELIRVLPSIGALDARRRGDFVATASVASLPAGTPIIRKGDIGEAAYFILEGRAVAGIPAADGEVRALSSMLAGDFFGEIGALTGSVRTANVVAEEDSRIVEVPAATLREMMSLPEVSTLILGKLTERLTRTAAGDLPRLGGIGQADLRELRRPSKGTALPKTYAEGETPAG